MPEAIADPKQKRHDDDALLFLWQHHVSPQFAGLLDHDGWQFDDTDPANLSYISDSGVRLGHNELRGLALAFCSACEADLRDNAAELCAGEIGVNEWHARAKRTCDDELILLAALAAGGVDELTEADYETVAGRLTTPEQVGSGVSDTEARLNEFARQLSAPAPEGSPPGTMGEAGSQAEVISRAGSYGQSAYPVYEQVKQATVKRNAEAMGVEVLEFNRLDDLAQHCHSTEFEIGCPECTAAGWVAIGSLPAPGTRQCGPRCRCELIFKLAPASENNPTP